MTFDGSSAYLTAPVDLRDPKASFRLSVLVTAQAAPGIASYHLPRWLLGQVPDDGDAHKILVVSENGANGDFRYFIGDHEVFPPTAREED